MIEIAAGTSHVNALFVKRRQRLKQLLDFLATREELTVEEACALTAASQATVRRAFLELAQTGEVEKTWGGIRKLAGVRPLTAPAAFTNRLANHADEKRAIARAAAALAMDGDVVMIDGGTTTYQLAEFIAGRRLRVITNSMVIAQAIDQLQGSRRGAEVLLCGGTLQPQSGIIAGPAAEAFLKRYHADWLFLGCAGVDARHVTNYDEAVLGSERLMIERSSKVALLADHTKLGRAAMCALCPTKLLNHVFTGQSAVESSSLAEIAAQGVKVVPVPTVA
jgi:DeoR family ulaG and ulaABCDEF operon transcriptional repressor